MRPSAGCPVSSKYRVSHPAQDSLREHSLESVARRYGSMAKSPGLARFRRLHAGAKGPRPPRKIVRKEASVGAGHKRTPTHLPLRSVASKRLARMSPARCLRPVGPPRRACVHHTHGMRVTWQESPRSSRSCCRPSEGVVEHAFRASHDYATTGCEIATLRFRRQTSLVRTLARLTVAARFSIRGLDANAGR